MSHSRLATINVEDNQLIVAGKPITAWLSEDRPHYIYSRDEITERINTLRTVLPEAVKLHYAIKANPMAEVIEHIAPQIDGLDVASQGEMALALNFQKAERISFAGPAKQVAELKAAIGAGVTLNVESPTELERIQNIAEGLGVKANVALRVNPQFELKQAGMHMAGGAKPFGIDQEQIPDVLAALNGNAALKGFHIFAGSQNLSHEALIATHNQTFALAESLVQACESAACADELAHINIGGGFGVPYFPNQPVLDLAPVSENLERLLSARLGRFADLDIILELGRYIVAEAGYYVCQISDIKHSRGTDYLMVNGGMHHHLANSGNFGQVLRKNYPTVLANKITGDETQQYDIAGPLCTPLDVVAAKITLPKAEIGEYVVVLQSGAYGFTASPQYFLGHQPPIERLV